MWELKRVVNKLKRRKAAGPDGVPMELIKELDEGIMERVLEVLNQWWREEIIPEDVLKARVVLIFKKGNTGNMDNYRPISLFNSMYKLFAALV